MRERRKETAGVGSKGRRGGDEKRRCREECERERQMPPVRPQGEGVGVLGRWRTEESGARCTLDKLGWSGAAPERGPERRKDCQCFQLSEVSDGPRCRGRRWPDFLRTWARCP